MEVGVDVWVRDKHGQRAWITGIVQSKTIISGNEYSIAVQTEDNVTVNYK